MDITAATTAMPAAGTLSAVWLRRPVAMADTTATAMARWCMADITDGRGTAPGSAAAGTGDAGNSEISRS